MSDEPVFPPVALMDGLGAIVRLSDSPTQPGSALLRIEPAKFSTEHEALLNRTTAELLRRSLGLWLRHSEEVALLEGEVDDLE